MLLKPGRAEGTAAGSGLVLEWSESSYKWNSRGFCGRVPELRRMRDGDNHTGATGWQLNS